MRFDRGSFLFGKAADDDHFYREVIIDDFLSGHMGRSNLGLRTGGRHDVLTLMHVWEVGSLDEAAGCKRRYFHLVRFKIIWHRQSSSCSCERWLLAKTQQPDHPYDHARQHAGTNNQSAPLACSHPPVSHASRSAGYLGRRLCGGTRSRCSVVTHPSRPAVVYTATIS